MADVTISNLPTGTPSGNALLPYSQGGSTYSASPSAIIAGNVGGILAISHGTDVTEYAYNPVSNNLYTSGFTVNLRKTNSLLILETITHGYSVGGRSGYSFFLAGIGQNVVNDLGGGNYTSFPGYSNLEFSYHLINSQASTISWSGQVVRKFFITPNANTVSIRNLIGPGSVTTSEIRQQRFTWTAYEVAQ